MKFITTKDNLVYAVNTVQKAVSNKTTLPILEGLLFVVTDSEIYLIGTDLEIGIKTIIEGEIIEQGSIVLSAKLLTELVRKLPDDEITISLNENNIATIKCLNSKFNIQGQPGEDFPEIPDVDVSNKIELSKDLVKSMIKETIFSVAKNESIPILTGELIYINKGIIKFIALDGYRLAISKGKLNNENISLNEVVPERTLNELYRILSMYDEDLIISYSGNQILFNIGKTSLTSRLLEGEFINYNQIIPNECTTRVKINVNDLLSSCERAALIVRDGKNNLIKMYYNYDNVEIISNSEMGNVHEELGIEMEGDPLKIAFNSKYLIDILKVIGEEEIMLEFTTAVSPCIIKPIEGDNFLYLVLPVRYIDHETT